MAVVRDRGRIAAAAVKKAADSAGGAGAGGGGRGGQRWRKDDVNNIVRFRANGADVGRLPTNVARWMAPLLDAGIVEVSGVVVDCPMPKLKSMDKIMLQLQCKLHYAAITEDVDAVRPDAITEVEIKRKDALVLMLATLGDAWAQRAADNSDGATPTAAAAAAGAAGGPPGIVDGGGGGVSAAASLAGDGSDGDDGNDEVDIISKQIETADALLDEADPYTGEDGGMRAKLRGYQKQSLSWMSDRESLAHQTAKGGRRLHASWRAQQFDDSGSGGGAAYSVAMGTDGPEWYWNVTNGTITTLFPSAESEARGGILADSMGLGKTVQMLALITTIKPTRAFLNPEDGGGGGAKGQKKMRGKRAQQKRRASGSGGGARGVQTFLRASDADSDDSTDDDSDGSNDAKGALGAASNPDGTADGAAAVLKAGGLPRDMPRRRSRATLIVCPMSLLDQWREEILRHTNITASQIVAYYGDDRKCGLRKLCDVAVVLTTYGTLSAGYKAFEEADGGSSSSSSNRGGGGRCSLYAVHFFRCILDEAHTIKNRLSQTSRACCAVFADRRWALTGTPIQNRLEDLYGLIKFLRVEPWSIFSHWSHNVGNVWNDDPGAGLKALHGILGPLMLRRTKNTVGKDGQPIVTLPSSSIQIRRLDFNPAEQDFYDAIDARSKTKFSEFVAGGSVLSNYANILELLLRLRQACDHPILTLKKSDGSNGIVGVRGGAVAGAAVAGAGAGAGNVRSDGHAFEDIDVLIARFHAHGEGSAEFASQISQQVKRLPERLGGGGGGSRGSGGGATALEELECPICLDEPDDPVFLPCLHSGCRECLTAVIARVHYCPVCRKPMEPSDAVGVIVKQQQQQGPPPVVSDYFAAGASAGTNPSAMDGAGDSMDADDADDADDGEDADDADDGAETGRTITAGNGRALTKKKGAKQATKAKKRAATAGWKTSTKLEAIVAHIRTMIEANDEDKCIIFSQWTSMLDLVVRILEDNGIAPVRLDGSMSQQQRVVALDRFKGDASVNVLLMSLRAGGVGLNLSAASHVILIDPWWNPA